jgi:hypothetical protein
MIKHRKIFSIETVEAIVGTYPGKPPSILQYAVNLVMRKPILRGEFIEIEIGFLGYDRRMEQEKDYDWTSKHFHH